MDDFVDMITAICSFVVSSIAAFFDYCRRIAA
jgi:hypothetical protein